jgi:hypothetical protein
MGDKMENLQNMVDAINEEICSAATHRQEMLAALDRADKRLGEIATLLDGCILLMSKEAEAKVYDLIKRHAILTLSVNEEVNPGELDNRLNTPTIRRFNELSYRVLAYEGKKKFLRSLADAMRSVSVDDRSAARRYQFSEMRDHAVAEVDGAIVAENPRWSVDTRQNGYKWLLWAFELRDEELYATQKALLEDDYKALSEFIGVGGKHWMIQEELVEWFTENKEIGEMGRIPSVKPSSWSNDINDSFEFRDEEIDATQKGTIYLIPRNMD